MRAYSMPVVALIRTLAWETPYAAGAALKIQKKIKKDEFNYYSALCMFCRCLNE